MAIKVTLTDSTTGEIIYPQTLIDSVQDSEGKFLKDLVLLLNNTKEFTPTADYQPATKKYVDDKVSAGGSGPDIVVSRTQPTGQKAGDFWFQIVD